MSSFQFSSFGSNSKEPAQDHFCKCGGVDVAPARIEKLEDRRLLSTVGLVPTDDAYVRDGTFANANFGSAADLAVKAASPGQGFVRSSYLKFDLTGQGTVTHAMLRLFGNQSPSSTDPSVGVAAHAVTSNSWSQNTITFNNAPAASSSTLASANVSGPQLVFYYLDLTSYIQQQQAANHTTASISLTGASKTSSDADFSSSNGSVDPVLILTTTMTPTPTATVFGAAGDAFVQGGSSANLNFGSSPQLQVKQASASTPQFTRISYLTFDLSSLGGSPTIDIASLALYGSVSGGGALQVDAYAVSGTFNQNTITYNNAPALGAPITSMVISGATPTVYGLDLTSYVQQQEAASHSTITIALVGHSASSQLAIFNSTDAATQQPSLVVVSG